RPEGEKGPLVCSLETFEGYYHNRAQLWEIHALTRARRVTGALGNEFVRIAQHYWTKAGQRRDLFPEIDGMLERIRRDRSSGSDFRDFKTGYGGMIEAEFLVQALQMRKNLWEPNWECAADRLTELRVLSNTELAKLRGAYGLLRRCESALRRYENNAISALPSSADEQRRLAIRLGYDDFEIFRND